MTPHIFNLINDFNANKLIIDWEQIWNDEDYQRSMFESLDVIQQSLGLIKELDQTTVIPLLGSLSRITSHLDFAMSVSNNQQDFFNYTAELEQELRKIINTPVWFKLAQERYPDFLKHTQEDTTHLATEIMIHLQPVLICVGLASLIEFDATDETDNILQNDCDDQECDDQECSA